MITKYNEYIKESNDVVDQFFKTYEDVKDWLDGHKIKNYTINTDLTVDVDSWVDLMNKGIYKIPVQFNKANNSFTISGNELRSLKGCPFNINGDFDCSSNELETLKYFPKIVKNGGIFFDKNPLKSIIDLDSKLLELIGDEDDDEYIKIWDKYFIYWIDKDPNIFKFLSDKVSYKIKNNSKYVYLFNANQFDLL
jgi:hypothetical protein